MTEQEFATKNGFDKEDMEKIKAVCKIFHGEITKIEVKND